MVEAGVVAAVPKALPKEKPPILATGALKREKTVNSADNYRSSMIPEASSNLRKEE